MINEKWRDIKDFSGYQISDRGRVRSKKSWSYFLMKPYINHGYPCVCFWKDGKNCNRPIHRLMLEAFIGLCPKGCEANHKDGNKRNYSLTNLEWVTHQQNMQHAVKTGLFNPTYPTGEKAGSSKLKDGEVWLIRRLLWFDVSKIKISKMFRASISTIYQISSGQMWPYVEFEPTDKDRKCYRENMI